MNKDDLLYSDFRTKINSYDFKSILEKHEEIDQVITNSVYTICCNYLEEIGAKDQNKKFVFSDSIFLNIKMDFNNVERCMTIYFLSSDGSPLTLISHQYHLFGTIRKITIRYPQRLNQTVHSLFERLGKFVNLTYTFLESIYITKFVEWNQKRKKILLNGIYELIETEVRNNNPKFKNKMWLSVIELDKESGDTGKFIFEFNDNFLREFIEKLKKILSLEFSPLVLVSHLISKTVNDEQTAKYKEGIYTFQTSVEDLNIRLDTDTYIFWVSSKLIYSEKGKIGMGCHTIAHHEQFLLSVDHSAFNHELALKIIEPIKEQIIDIFRQNVLEYQRSPMSKITFKYSAKIKSTLIQYGPKVKDVFVEKSIEQAIWEPLKGVITHFFG